MTPPDSGPLDRDEQLGRLTEELQLAIAANEDIEASALAARYSLSENEVLQVIVALRVVQESLDEDLDSNTTDLAPPELSADYEVGKELGRGGMGIVYRAHQKSLNRDVAVKVLRPGDLQFGDAIQRFEREARSLARLRHRHIVSVHEVGKASGFVYFTMDLIVGMSLHQLIAGGDMTNTRAVKLLRQVASAMTYAHSQGVVHRDLKPANILVDTNDDAFVVDFGLARDLGGSPEEVSAATMTGQMIGTPSYMSPEQALGDRERIGEASDIYALGAVLYECLTGKRPFHSLPLAKLMYAVIETEPTAPRKVNPQVPEDLEVICQTAMQKRIEDRYPTVLAFAEDLERFSVGREILARRRSKTKRLARFVNRNRTALVTAVIPAIALLLLAWTFWLPGVLQDRDIGFGHQLLANGNDEAALVAYRSAFAQHAPEQFGLVARTRYARCLVNKAGRLQLRGPEDFEAERDLCLKEASGLLESYVQQTRRPTRTPFDAEQMFDALYEWNRIDAFAGGQDDMTQLPAAERQARWQRDLNGASRDATLVHIAAQIVEREISSAASPDIDSQTFLAIVRQRQRLPVTVCEDLQHMFRGLSARGPRSHHDPELEAGLIALIRDRSNDLEIRLDAASLFHDLGTMPFAFYKVRRTIDVTRRLRGSTSSRSSTWHEPLVTEQELTTLVENWDSLQRRDRNEQYRKRVEFVAEALFRDRQAPAVKVGKTEGWDLRHWLEQHTGVRHHRKDQWLMWWQEHQHEDPKSWLLNALDWDIAPAALTPELVLHRFRNVTGQSSIHQAEYLHWLLTLTVPEGIRQPSLDAEMFVGNILPHWERALGLVPSNEHRVRVATLAFVNGSPTPQLIWQKQFTLTADEQTNWFEWNTPEVERPGYYVGFGRRGWMRESKGTWLYQGNASLRWNGVEVVVRLNQTPQTAFHASTHGGNFGHNGKAIVGKVAMISSRHQYPEGGQTFAETLSVAYVERADVASKPWQLEDWLAAIKDTTRTLAASTDPIDYEQNASALALANFLPATAQLESIRQLAAIPGDTYSELARRARLLAGDESALSVEIRPQDRTWFATPTFWLRLALTTDNANIKKHAFAQLRSAPLLPAHARTLLEAHNNGTTMPEWLVSKANAAPSTLASLFGDSWAALTGLGVLLLSMLVLPRSMWRNRSNLNGKRFGILFWFATLLLSQFTVAIDGTIWNPPWLGLFLNALASWFVCWRLIAGWTWMVPAIWWSTTIVLHLLGQLHYDAFAWTAGVILFAHLCTRHATSYAGAEMRKRRLRIARRAR